MIIDTSALVAMFADEPERSRFLLALSHAHSRSVSAGCWIEFGTVLVRRFGIQEPAAVQTRFAAALDIQTSPVEERQVAAAALGYATYGRGSGHRARLNFGDCFAYALANATGEPLLFKGDDFNHTDLLLAPESAFPR